jgi:hypothetical protein
MPAEPDADGHRTMTPHILEQFDIDDLLVLSREVEKATLGSENMVDCASRVVDHLHRCVVRLDGSPAFVRVQLHKTHPLGRLPPSLQASAARGATGLLQPRTPCLTLLAAQGSHPPASQTSPLFRSSPTALISEGVPGSALLTAILAHLELSVPKLVEGDSVQRIVLRHNLYDVLQIDPADPSLEAEAPFLDANAVRSVLVAGSVLPNGDPFFLVYLSSVVATAQQAQLLRSLTLVVKSVLVPHTHNVFPTATS